MRFGAYLPTYWDDYGSTSIPVTIAETATMAEALGYEGVWANDSVVNPAAAVHGTVEGGQVIELLITLASLVHLVPRLTLGTAVVVLPQRHPILVAKQAADLHLLSGGRLVLGVGIGWRPEEFALLGADFANRGAAADEAIEVMRVLWRGTPEPYHGQFHRLDAAVMRPPPPRRGPTHLDRRPHVRGYSAGSQVRQWLDTLRHGPRHISVPRGNAAGADAWAAVPNRR